MLSEIRELLWRYTTVHFEGGSENPFPTRVPHPGIEEPEPEPGTTWDTVESIDDIMPNNVREMLKT
ncbi:hypothetical protein MINS_12500 [Mycolicibacterium insubricum]|uniref:Uncharacterized protein n=1 Tax=Mycolicibacterium insubricum TaxID=444597 RepID=A0A1X0CUQ1_9MYCO|nr:hypothetical protein [Mycolicibacterium insubricum]MCV7080272.1 hypothetical protein [Mycolicibacterium insubricum]ORA63190.1 hypothetical protein BST26_20545 [Mycolicibacterium insubricum]BBZ65821.1 hypothetical protein MINS_12500 [Mycolicibacterium insubricum]